MATFKSIPGRAGAGAQLVECLHTMHEPLHGFLVANKLGEVMHVSNPRTWEMRAGGSESQGLPWLHSDLEACLD